MIRRCGVSLTYGTTAEVALVPDLYLLDLPAATREMNVAWHLFQSGMKAKLS